MPPRAENLRVFSPPCNKPVAFSLFAPGCKVADEVPDIMPTFKTVRTRENWRSRLAQQYPTVVFLAFE